MDLPALKRETFTQNFMLLLIRILAVQISTTTDRRRPNGGGAQLQLVPFCRRASRPHTALECA